MMVMEPDPILDCKGAIALDNVFCDSMLPPDQDGQQMVLAMAYVPWQHLQTVYAVSYTHLDHDIGSFQMVSSCPQLNKIFILFS